MKIQKANSLYTRQLGLTLIEILIAMAITSLIIGALVTAFISHNRTSAAEETRMELQQNLRIAVDRLKHELRHAGFGNYDAIGPDNKVGDYETFISNINNGDSDSMVVISAFKLNDADDSEADIWADEVVSDFEVKVSGEPSPSLDPDNDYKKYLSFFPDPNANQFYTIKSYNDDNNKIIEFDEQIDSEVEGSIVYMVSPVEVLIEDKKLLLKNLAYNKAVNPDQYWTIAENITDIQFEFYVPGQDWQEEPSDETIENQDIRKIRFTIWGEKDANGKTISMESQGEVVLRNAL